MASPGRERSPSELSVNLANTPAEGCPAFTAGCPFAFNKKDFEALPSIVENLPKDVYEKCPAFKEGCPFKEADSVEGLYNKLSEMPGSHRLGQSNIAATAVEKTMQAVHQQSKALKAKYSQQCPVFATSCPFKTVTSDGEPLVQEMDSVINSWGLTEVDLMLVAGKDETAVDLSKALKAGTKSVHRAAENVRFVRDFLRGQVSRESYIELLKALYHIYDAMEKALDSLPEELRHCDFSVLRRTETLAEDIRYFTGVGDDVELDVGTPSPTAKTYVERLARISKDTPLLVLSHAYTRYLGDLSGGQILAKAAVKAYGLPEGNCGIKFYQFEKVGTTAQDSKVFKKMYRSSLDALQLSAQDADALVKEANTAFIMNMLIFEERDMAAGHIERVRTVDEAMELVKTNTTPLKFQQAYTAAKGGSGKCPFLPAGNDAGPSRDIATAMASKCPWPFIWLHAPSVAFMMHPLKNIGGALTLVGLSTLAWRAPKSTGAGVLGGFLALRCFKPRAQPGSHGSVEHLDAELGHHNPEHTAFGDAKSGGGKCPFLPAGTDAGPSRDSAKKDRANSH